MSNNLTKKDSSPLRLERLFAPKRDLTFGNNKNMRSKAPFKPNLLTERSKRNLENVEKPEEVKRIKLPNNRGRKKKEQLIQSYGVWGEGTSIKETQPKGRRKKSDTVKEEGIDNQNEIQLDAKKSDEGIPESYSEAQIIKFLQGMSVDESNDSKNFQDEDIGMLPVKIKKYHNQELSETIKCENDDMKTMKQEEQLPSFDVDNSPLVLFQFPDTLPSSVNPAVHDESNSKQRCTFLDLNDGLIGKIIKYKSGKAKLVLGDSISYNIGKGVDGEFQQNLVTIQADTAKGSASIVDLGTVESKYVVSPDWKGIMGN